MSETSATMKRNQHFGTIVKALSGYYYVQPDQPLVDIGYDMKSVQCRARGVFKKRGLTPLVGDKVQFSLTENGEGTVDELLPRSSQLIRPPVANIDLVVLVFSVIEPSLNTQLLDKFLVHIEHAEIKPILCLSKEDLQQQEGAQANEAKEAIATIHQIYSKLGYEIYDTSATEQTGVAELKERLQGHIAVFAGQSGVGKSSLLNQLVPGLNLETSAISQRLGRGKHTTRHVELIDIDGGWVADTPGFSQLDFAQLGVEDLSYCFVEMRERAGDCKFRGCTHVQEPGCAVIAGVQAGSIAMERYEHYKIFLQEMNDSKRRY
ncbi:ribosome small subunit-dependent GTPase A [Paenibacillus yanchengensis]|uniref:Small ribosomal subunit biogenesis GTPase RsgA n=1 Tax=Paenibacillus yanchengensis TaxID=2035833 RepID=A0ABW4YN49_9BACL